MNSLFTWSNPQVKKLLGWRTGSEEEKWAEKAVDSLVKKLKKKKSGPGSLEDLEMALANPGSLSKCVTIPKSLDGRLQVSHKKGLPHVIYCKVWRWPDLQSHQELRAIPECIYPYEQKADHICINPYHYMKVDHPNKHFIQSANTIGGHAASPYADSIASGSNYNPGQSSPPMQMPSPMGSYHSTASPYSVGSSYHTATSPSSILSDDESPMVIESVLAYPPPVETPLKPPPIYWTTISYYELNTRIGDQYKLVDTSVVVDGFTDPTMSGNRICLGQITNVNRNSTCENTRKAIGRGLKLDYTPTYDVHLTNQSGNSLFVQSMLANAKMNKPAGTVLRVPAGHSLCVFENALFCQMLQQARTCRPGDPTALYDMHKMAFIRISFVKGWGPEYPTRQDITTTPCWIEIQLHQALAWIDQSLPIGNAPDVNCNSDTI